MLSHGEWGLQCMDLDYIKLLRRNKQKCLSLQSLPCQRWERKGRNPVTQRGKGRGVTNVMEIWGAESRINWPLFLLLLVSLFLLLPLPLPPPLPFSFPSSLFSETESLINPGTNQVDKGGYLASPRDTPCFCLPIGRMTRVCYHTQLCYFSSGELTQVCMFSKQVFYK